MLRSLIEERLELSIRDETVIERFLDAGWDLLKHGLFTRKGSAAAQRSDG